MRTCPFKPLLLGNHLPGKLPERVRPVTGGCTRSFGPKCTILFVSGYVFKSLGFREIIRKVKKTFLDNMFVFCVCFVLFFFFGGGGGVVRREKKVQFLAVIQGFGCMCVCVCMYVYVCVCARVLVCACVRTRVCVCACMQLPVCDCLHPYVCEIICLLCSVVLSSFSSGNLDCQSMHASAPLLRSQPLPFGVALCMMDLLHLW